MGVDFFGEDPFDSSKLHEDLKPYLSKSTLGTLLRSPLVYQVPFFSWKMANESYLYKLNIVKDLRIDEALGLYERPYRLSTLYLRRYELNKKQLQKIFKWVWKDTEFPHQYGNMPLQLFQECGYLTDTRKKLAGEELTIYRGQGAHKAGISWTLDLDKARWFATRLRYSNEVRQVRIAKVKVPQILAYFTGRDESEIVIDPKEIKHKRLELIH